jgi:hypothetical protein
LKECHAARSVDPLLPIDAWIKAEENGDAQKLLA